MHEGGGAVLVHALIATGVTREFFKSVEREQDWQSPAAQRDAGRRPLGHYADAWLDGLAGQVKPRVLADYRANYRR